MLHSRRVWFAIATAVAVAATIAMASIGLAAGAGTFTGGPDTEPPIFVPNDHTPLALHFSATGLTPSTSYYLKMRLNTAPAPSGPTNRGFTWNAITGQWVQERDAWTSFPQVTTDASGNLNEWTYIKFGDETRAGVYYIMVSLSSTGSASTFNGSNVQTVTVLNMATEGSWVHNGIAVTGSSIAAKRVELTASSSATTTPNGLAVLGLGKAEANLLDDDSNGVVDDEDYGPVGAANDFRLSAPASTSVDVFLNRKIWAQGNNVMTGPADTDIALGAADMVPPSGIETPSVDVTSGKVSLAWNGATDNVGVTQYTVYRSLAPLLGAPYTPHASVLATLTSTSYDDTDVINAAEYTYVVRARDAATNVGPRSGLATATATIAGPLTDVVVDPTVGTGSNGWYQKAPTVTLSSTDASATYSAWDSAVGPFAETTMALTAPEGVHTLYFYSTKPGAAEGAHGSVTLKVDSTLPTAATMAPAFSTLVSATGRFRVSWSGADAPTGSGVGSYDVRYRLGGTTTQNAWKNATTSTYIYTNASAGKTYYFSTRAHDAAGNVGQWSPEVATVVPFDDRSATRTGTWATSVSSYYFLGTSSRSKTKGASASLAFRGTRLSILASVLPTGGKAAVYIDGTYYKTINTRAAATHTKQLFYIKGFPSASVTHTVKVVNLGTSGGSYIFLDGFAVTR